MLAGLTLSQQSQVVLTLEVATAKDGAYTAVRVDVRAPIQSRNHCTKEDSKVTCCRKIARFQPFMRVFKGRKMGGS